MKKESLFIQATSSRVASRVSSIGCRWEWTLESGVSPWLAWVLWYLGYPEQAFNVVGSCYSGTRALSFRLAKQQRYILRQQSIDCVVMIALCSERTETVIAIATERESPQWLASGTFLRGWALADLGQYEEGIAAMQQGLAGWRAIGNDQLGQPSLLLADMYRRSGKAAEGLRLMTTAVPELKRSGERWWEAELYRIKGELLSASTETGLESETEQYFHKAIMVARQQAAKSLELRATMSLARLWQQQGKTEDARQLLAGIYGWFTEGFETGDLQEAKALLAELAEGENDRPVIR